MLQSLGSQRVRHDWVAEQQVVTSKKKKKKKMANKHKCRGFTAGSGAKNPPANAGDTGSFPDPGRFHMPWNN